MSIFKKALFFGLSFLASLAAIDAYLQLAEIQAPMETRIDARLGPVYIPNRRISRFNEGFFLGSVNAYGYMGPAVPRSRVRSERRILLLGDSFVLGHTVLPRHYFGRYLEQDLRRETGEDVLALNFGRADFNLANMFQNYRDFVGTFDHDLTLFFLGESDLVPWGQVVSSLYPTVRLREGEIVIDRVFRLSTTYRVYKAVEPLFTRSAVLRLGFNAYKVVIGGDWRTILLDRLASAAPPRAEAPVRPIPAGRAGMPDLNRAILRELSRDPRNVLVVQTPLAPGLRDDVVASGMKIIDLGAFLERLRAQGRDPYFWPVTAMRGHWNHAAQPKIGRFLAEEIVRLGLLRGRSGPSVEERERL